MTCPPSLQQQEGMAANSHLPLNPPAQLWRPASSAGLQPPQPWQGVGRLQLTARLGRDSRLSAVRETQSKEEGDGQDWRDGGLKGRAQRNPLAGTQYPQVCPRGPAVKWPMWRQLDGCQEGAGLSRGGAWWVLGGCPSELTGDLPVQG